MYRKYANYVEQIFKVMRSVEENSAVKPDKRIVKLCEGYVDFLKICLSHIGMSRQILANPLEAHLSFIATWNKYVRKLADGYQKLS